MRVHSSIALNIWKMYWRNTTLVRTIASSTIKNYKISHQKYKTENNGESLRPLIKELESHFSDYQLDVQESRAAKAGFLDVVAELQNSVTDMEQRRRKYSQSNVYSKYDSVTSTRQLGQYMEKRNYKEAKAFLEKCVEKKELPRSSALLDFGRLMATHNELADLEIIYSIF